jgi:uncharacterized protein YbbC (DUF1343 family)
MIVDFRFMIALYFDKIMLRQILFSLFFAVNTASLFAQHNLYNEQKDDRNTPKIVVGAARTDQYLKLLQNKNVALVINQTSRVGNRFLADTLKDLGIDIKTIFAPEHGFRGNTDAGAKVENGTDPVTGIPVISLYGKKLKPTAEDLSGINIVVFDIQDVGCRFYTFLSTLQYVMEACAENGKDLLILDRPDPNGYYVDGPVLDMQFKSFVGVSKIPVVYGLTLGEYAQMAKGEGWIKNADKLSLQVITCQNYDHDSRYKLPVNPSPNLRNERAVFLYPSLCFFEGTNVSVGRGTDHPFQVIGSPYTMLDSGYVFTPASRNGATDPPQKGEICKGYDLRKYNKETAQELSTEMKGLNLKYLLKMYALCSDKDKFFTKPDFFDKLAGTDQLRKQIIDGKTESEIRSSWQPALNQYKVIRKKYLLYRDFE